MSEKLDKIIDNLKQSSVWVRIVLMVAFAVVLYPVFLVLLVLMIAQVLFVIITGESNANLRSLGAALSTYIFQIVQFMSYVTDVKPFPFSDFPKAENDDLNVSNEIKQNKKSTVTNKKPAAKKVAKKKAASRNPTTKKSE